MADSSLLEVSNIETCYGLSQVLFGMSLAVAPGEMVTLMGRNGMGKTTTVRSIMGLTRAMAGSIRFGGRDIRVAGMCKGAGMIGPRMATMLSIVLTDATVGPDTLGSLLGGSRRKR